MPLFMIGFLALGLGTVAVTSGRVPVTRRVVWFGRRAKVIGWCCWAFGLICVIAWATIMITLYVRKAG